jgi:hypothetical protein
MAASHRNEWPAGSRCSLAAAAAAAMEEIRLDDLQTSVFERPLA